MISRVIFIRKTIDKVLNWHPAVWQHIVLNLVHDSLSNDNIYNVNPSFSF